MVGLLIVFAGLGPGAAGAAPPLTYDTPLSVSDGHGEPEIAVNPTDSRNLVANLVSGVVTSHDGGNTWKQVMRLAFENPRIPGDDPLVAAAADGRLYAAWSSMPVLVSGDEGRTWSVAGNPLNGPNFLIAPGALQISPQDGPIQMGPAAPVACDRQFLTSDASTGTLYISCADHGDASGGESGLSWEAGFLDCRANVFSSELTTNCGRRYLSASHDHGKTWSRWYPEDSASYPAGFTGAFAGIPVAAHGVLATAYVGGRAAGSGCDPCAIFETSRDEGRSWIRHVIPGANPSIYRFNPLDPLGGPNSIAGLIGNDSQTVWFEPYVAADPSHRGRFAIMILDDTRTELLVFVTDNFGATWGAPAVLGRGQPGFRDKPAIAYAPDGSLGVMWKSAYPERGLSFDVWAAVAQAGGTRFGAPRRLNDATSPVQSCGIGTEGQAYTCDELSWMAMDNHYLHAAWGDGRGGENPWYGRYHYTADPQFAVHRRSRCRARSRSQRRPHRIGHRACQTA
jgi:hypothetical protein